MCIMTMDLEVLQQIYPIKRSGGEIERKDKGEKAWEARILRHNLNTLPSKLFFWGGGYCDRLVMFGR